jgi:hypothetical protein
VHALRIDTLVIGQLEQLRKHIAANLGRPRLSRDAEAITAAGDFDIEAAFDLPQVFIKLAAKIGKAVVIGGLENDVSRSLDRAQNVFLEPLFGKPLCY